jgi:hypothetical protein
MAVELLGATVLPHVVIVAVIAYVLTGHRSIYGAQRIARTKGGRALAAPRPMRDAMTDANTDPVSDGASSARETTKT